MVDPLPNGAYLSLLAYVAEGSDFALNEAVARLQAALPGRVVRANPLRKDCRLLSYWGGKQIVGFFIEVTSEAGRPDDPVPDVCQAIALQACEVLSGFRGVRAHDVGQGKSLLRQWQEGPKKS